MEVLLDIIENLKVFTTIFKDVDMTDIPVEETKFTDIPVEETKSTDISNTSEEVLEKKDKFSKKQILTIIVISVIIISLGSAFYFNYIDLTKIDTSIFADLSKVVDSSTYEQICNLIDVIYQDPELLATNFSKLQFIELDLLAKNNFEGAHLVKVLLTQIQEDFNLN